MVSSDELKIDDWRIPYIGRPVSEAFWQQFANGEQPKSAEEVHEQYVYNLSYEREEENFYDTDQNWYELVIRLTWAGRGVCRITEIIPIHRNVWSTTSDGNDMHRRKTSQSLFLREADLGRCVEVLNACTEDDLEQLTFNLAWFSARKNPGGRIVREKDGWRVAFDNARHLTASLRTVIRAAYSFPEIFIFPKYASETLSSSIGYIDSFFLGYIDIESFYAGFDYELLVRRMIARMVKSMDVVSEVTQQSDKIAKALVRARMEEAVESRPEFTESFGRDTYIKVESLPYEMLRSIPAGSLCYFDVMGEFAGYVTPEYLAFRPGEKDSAASLLEDMTVVTAKGESIGLLLDRGFACLNQCLYQYELWHDDDGRIFYEDEFVGFARVCELGCNGILKLVRYVAPTGDNIDSRWMGLPVLGFVRGRCRSFDCEYPSNVPLLPDAFCEETDDVDDSPF